MSQRVCLRCDWSGDTKAVACPSCGAPLFAPAGADRRAEPARRGPRLSRLRGGERGPDPGQTPSPTGPASQDAAPATTSDRSTAGRIGMALLLVAAVAGVIVVQSNTKDPNAPSGRIEGMRGVLLYVDPDPATGRSRLWLWNLETGGIREGPEIATPTEIVDASQAGTGWVGLTSASGDEQRASYLDGYGEDDEEVRLASGVSVAWGPFGEHVSSLTRSEPGWCTILTRAIALETDVSFPPFPCDRAGTVALSSASTFVDVTEDGSTSIYSTLGSDRLVLEVADATLAGVSETGRVLAVPTVCRRREERQFLCPSLSILDVTPDPDPRNDPTKELIRYGEEDASLTFDGLAGWSRFGDRAYIVGSYFGVLGLYSVPVPRRSVPIEGSIEPDLVMPSSTTAIHVTETATGELLVARGDTLILVRDTAPLEYPEPPDGAPMPEGPILWLPAVAGGP